MLNRFSSEFLIKSVLGGLAALSLLVVAAWLWVTAADYQASERALRAVDVSGYAFKALLNQRTDRSTTIRTWNVAEPITPDVRAYVATLRDAEMPALRTTLELLATLEFTDRETLLPGLRRTVETLATLQAEYWAGIVQPRTARRANLAAEYGAAGLELQKSLERIAANLFAGIKDGNPFIVQMMQVKQLAWLARNYAGEASLLISNGLAAGRLAPDSRLLYASNTGGSDAVWAAIDDTVAGLQVSPAFTKALADARATFFATEYSAVRLRLIDALIAGTKPEMTVDQWSPYTVPRLGVMQDIAEAALGEARVRAMRELSASTTHLAEQACLLLAALLLSAIGMVAVTRRVIRPLRTLRDSMLQLAEGDLSAAVPYADRSDEIGSLARAFGVFRQQASDKKLIEEERSVEHARAGERQASMEIHIHRFESEVGTALDGLGGASVQMDHASEAMETIAAGSSEQVNTAAGVAEEASANVAGIAAATEQLSASIAEISRQLSQAAQITNRAVEETRQTDGTVRRLSESAGRIGEVVKLISDIASRTNLLALNATIEAARAGDAGKGFAVVASEVKSLANQTAKATEEISTQIAAVQSVTEAAVTAISQIGATIDEVSAVANSIAAGVEQQGASTQEIARNTQEASRRTHEMSLAISGVSQTAEATGTTAHAVKSAAAELGAEASRLRDQVRGFLEQMRAA